MNAPHEDFFIGWADRVPRGQGGFLARVALGFLAAFLLLPLGLARAMDDSGGGGKVADAVYDYVGLRVRIDGEVERRGDILVFKADPATAVVP